MFKRKIFTFCFQMTMPDGDRKEIHICAETKEQAMCLYDDYCRNDMDLPYVKPDKIEIIYDTNDATQYGKAYASLKEHQRQNKKLKKHT